MYAFKSDLRMRMLKQCTSVQRIVAELVDFRDNVTISVSVRAP